MSKEAKSLWNVIKGTKGSTGSYEKNVQQRAEKYKAKKHTPKRSSGDR